MPEKCHVHNCSQPVVAKGLCQKHYKRVKRQGTVESTRSDDWGQREKHPAYSSWCNLRRYHRLTMQESWRDDFWQFVKDVPEKPQSAQACRADSTQPWGKDNFYWKERREGPAEIREYMRIWRQKAREANPEYYADQDLRKNYGVTLEWYREQLSKQGDVCAICRQPETTVIRGKMIAMSVDHDHNTGRARGLLCTACNRGLGLFRDSDDLLQAAIQYLRS